MKLKEITVTSCGALKDRVFPLSDGMNVIYGENGAGKSTLMGLLRLCFYGTKKNHLRDRLLPWDGGKIIASIRYEQDGREMVLQSSFGSTKRGSWQSILDHVSGEETPLSEEPGRALFGMGEETFEKTAFVRQGGLMIDATSADEIADRLTGLDQSGALSYDSVKKKLTALQKELRKEKQHLGLLDEAELAVTRLSEQLSRAEATAAEAAEGYRRLERTERELTRAQRLEREWVDYRLFRRRRLCEQLKAELDPLSPVRPQTDGSELISRAREWAAQESALAALTAQQKEIGDPPEPFCTEEEYRAALQGGGKLLPMLLSVAAVLTAAAGIWHTPLWWIGTAALAVGAVLLILRRPSLKKRFGCSSREELTERYTEALRRQSEYAAEAEQQKRLRQSILAQQEQMRENAAFGQSCQCENAAQLLALGEEQRERMRRYESALAQKKTLETSLAQAMGGATWEELRAAKETPEPPCSEEELAERLRQLRQQREQLIREQDLLFADGRTPEVIRAELDRQIRRRDAYRKREQILLCCVEVLEHAYLQMEQQFGGSLNEEAGALLACMTDGAYCETRISRKYAVTLTEQGTAHPLERFSGGTADQAYLAYRLAMLRQMGGTIPVFLDDVLMQYDDRRAELTLAALADFSRETGIQLLLFTCRSRDFRLAEQRADIKCTEISKKG